MGVAYNEQEVVVMATAVVVVESTLHRVVEVEVVLYMVEVKVVVENGLEEVGNKQEVVEAAISMDKLVVEVNGVAVGESVVVVEVNNWVVVGSYSSKELAVVGKTMEVVEVVNLVAEVVGTSRNTEVLELVKEVGARVEGVMDK